MHGRPHTRVFAAFTALLRIDGILYYAGQVKKVTMLYRQAIYSYMKNPAGFDRMGHMSTTERISGQGLVAAHYSGSA